MENTKLTESSETRHLKLRIEEWRRTGTKYRMPEDLWGKATQVAEIHGAAATAAFLKIGRAGIIKRLTVGTRPSVYPSTNKQIKPSYGFVELSRVPEAQKTLTVAVRLTNQSSDSHAMTIAGLSSVTDWENMFSGWLRASQSIRNEVL